MALAVAWLGFTQAGSKCSALSFGKDNKCCLHDRTAADYSVAPEAGSRHTVKMMAG